jgi:probable F420-dependent oxidoreductase
VGRGGGRSRAVGSATVGRSLHLASSSIEQALGCQFGSRRSTSRGEENEGLQPRLIVGLSNYHDFLPLGGWDGLLDVAQAADAAGVDALSVVDHVALGGDLSGYPYGSFPGGAEAPWLEPLTTLAAIAGRTRDVRLMTGILIAPLRPPALLAKMAATLDQLSGGRLELGVGTGWLAKEYEAVGLDFGDRGRLLDDALELCQALWSGRATDWESPRLAFDDVTCSPPPLQPGGVPFWVGGELHPRNVERIVRFADGWIPSPPTGREQAAAGAAQLHEALRAAGRDPSRFRVRMSLPAVRDDDGRPDLARSLEAVPALLAAGATDVFVPSVAFARDPAATRALFAPLADGFRAAVD